jgi:hypothetical protein
MDDRALPAWYFCTDRPRGRKELGKKAVVVDGNERGKTESWGKLIEFRQLSPTASEK